MTQGKRLYRSRDALVGGVCAGVADYFSIDPVIVRILVLVFTIASGGILGIAYIALWIMLPKAPKEPAPLDVEPQSVHSDTYGAVDCDVARGINDQDVAHGTSAAQAAARHYTSSAPYAGAAHVPPEPPVAASWARCSAPTTPPWTAGNPAGPDPTGPRPATPQPVSAPSYEGWSYAAQGPARNEGRGEPAPKSVKAALVVGSFLLFFGIVATVATFVEDIAWWQYWPLIFMILGIVHMVIPGVPGYRMRAFVDGLVCFFAGATLLTMSLGLVSWQSLGLMFSSLWPLLLMMVGFFVLGGALKSPILTLLAGLCFVAFCIAGLAWYSMPGAMDAIVLSAPYGREYRFVVPEAASEAIITVMRAL